MASSYLTRPVFLLLLLLLAALFASCVAQSGDGSDDDEDQLEMKTSYACENGMLTLECPLGHVIRIMRANYGRFSLTLCNPLGITSNMNLRCISVTSRRIVATECDGHNRCEFQVTNQLFGDPCPGTSKYAEVKHYCEPEDVIHIGWNPTLRPLPNLPDAPIQPRRPSVPVPEKIQVCMHRYPSTPSGSVYDVYWQMPETSQTILHFMLKYSVGEEAHEKEMPGLRTNDRYSFTFTPDEGKEREDHLFAIKAFSLDYGWGEYSDFSSPERCQDDGSGTFVTHVSFVPVITVTTSTTTTTPKEDPEPPPMCLAVDKMGVRWPETWPNEVRTDLCPRYLGQGLMHYKCTASGEWDPHGPYTDDCIDVVPSTTKQPTSTTTTPTPTPTTPTTTWVPTTRGAPMHSSSLITDMLRKLNHLSIRHVASLDLPSLLPRLTRDMSNYLDSLTDGRAKQHVANYFKDSILALSDELLKYGGAWANMSVTQQRRTAASLLQALQVTGLMTAETMDAGATNITRKSNIAMKVMNMGLLHGEPASLDGRGLTGPTMTKVNQFTIPAAVLHQAMEYDDISVPVVFVVLSNMSEWLAPEPNSGSVSSNVIDARPRQEPVRRIINSDIVSASVSRRPLKNLVEPVVFLTEHRQVESVANPKCSFWDVDLSAWSSEGCWVAESNRTHTVCKCDHLTSFAVLMDITGATLLIPAKARFSLELITYIGCTVSILCLMLSWVTFACFKSLDCDRNTIHKHLVFCLMVAQIVLVVGVGHTKPAILCSVVAGVLHFFFLASFAWMCLEGVQLYVMLVEVFESERSRVLWYYLFGYGVPAVIVTTSAGIYPHGYGTEFHCWLSVERGFIWSFVGPAMAVMLVNVIMLAIAIYIMVRHSSMSHTMRQKSAPQKMSVSGSVYSMETSDHTYHRPEIPAGYQCLAGARYSMGGSSLGGGYGVVGGGGSHLYASIDHLELLTCERPSRDEKLTWVKGAVVLVVLLGLTWVFGVLYLDNVYHTLVFSYIFTILNTLQGLFIFCFHCLLNEKVQKEYRRLVRHSHWLPDCLRVRYGGASTTTGSREPSSSGHAKKQHGADGESSSNSTKPFLNKDPRFSSSMPSSSDGATSSRLSTDISHNNNRKASRSSTFRSNGTDSRSLRHSEVNGIMGDLSEVPDCSVVDSEFVSEYCQQNLQVSTEVKRYSTASEEDSGRGDGVEEEGREEGDWDHLAALSVESLSNRQPAYVVSSSDYGDGERSEGWADSDNVDGDDVDHPLHYINLPPGQRQHHHMAAEEEEDDDDGLVDGRDVRAVVRGLPESLPLVVKHTGPNRVPVSTSRPQERLVNSAVSRPQETCLINSIIGRPQESLTNSVAGRPQDRGPLPRLPPRRSPSLTDVENPGPGERVPAHTSIPCLQGNRARPPAASCTEGRDLPSHSLPSLVKPHVSGLPLQPFHNHPGSDQSVNGHSSEGPVYFSPFRFPAADC